MARLNSEEGVVRVERRNYDDRASTFQRVLQWLRSTPVPGAPTPLTSSQAGLRILKQLAIRGLVRATDEGWIPQPLLLNPPALVETG